MCISIIFVRKKLGGKRKQQFVKELKIAPEAASR